MGIQSTRFVVGKRTLGGGLECRLVLWDKVSSGC